ncbi:MAG: radical SAM protein, partial [Proteobacteria bacterium]|nr:radical SAM protein [Pseudomonadota bacterium]
MYQISNKLIQKYSTAGPRYTSYPTAPMWGEISLADQRDWLNQSQNRKQPLSLYLHIPFCWDRCVYCGCNVLVTHQQGRSGTYVDFLTRELEHLVGYIKSNRKIRQLHFGGGTPNFLLDKEFELIIEKIHSHFQFEQDCEVAIELDPTMIREGQLEHLNKLGFNRLSMGVQDFDDRVQKAVKRVQSKELTQLQLDRARELGFKGINFDLIYGLPFQTVKSFEKTIDDVIRMRPERLAI